MAKKNRFTFVIQGFLLDPIKGPTVGPHVQAYLIGKELLNRGWDVSYISVSKNRERYENHEIDGIRVHFLPLHPKLPWYGEIRIGRKLFGILNEIGPHVIYTRGRSTLPWIVSRYSRQNQALSVWNAARDRDFNRYQYVRMKGGSVILPKLLARYLMFSFSHVLLFERGIRDTDVCICQNEFQRQKFSESWPENDVAVIDPVVDIPGTVPPKRGIPRVLWVSGIKEEKQPDLFMDLAKRCTGMKIEFDCIGNHLDRKLVAQLESYAKMNRRFRYHGPIDYPSIGSFFQNAHIFVNTSIQEGFPNTFLQAWVNETPVISLNVDPNNLLTNEGLGVLARSSDRIYEATVYLLKNPGKRVEIGKRAREYVLDHHAASRIVDQLEKHVLSRYTSQFSPAPAKRAPVEASPGEN